MGLEVRRGTHNATKAIAVPVVIELWRESQLVADVGQKRQRAEGFYAFMNAFVMQPTTFME